MQRIKLMKCHYWEYGLFTPTHCSMIRSFFTFCLSLLFFSCKKNDQHPVCCLPPASQGRIFYQGSNVAYGTYGWEEICSMNPDGSDQRFLTNFSRDGALNIGTGEPALSPDGKLVYFTSNKDNNGQELFVMNADGSNPVKLIANARYNDAIRDPFIFQNGEKIVYCLETDSFANRHGLIMTANKDGSGARSLINYPADGNCYHPCVSPDNSTIVYANLSGGRIELWAMNTDGSNKRALTSAGPVVKWHAQFSPDGRKIVFDAAVGVGTDIFMINADGSGMTQLTDYSRAGTINNITWGPTFSKDGSTIYFASDEYNGVTSQLYKMNADGSGKVKITHSAEDKFNPCIK